MNKKIAALTLTSLLSACSLYALAAESTQGTALPPAAIPGINQGKGSGSNEDKAEQKGEKAPGSASGSNAEDQSKEEKSQDDRTKQSNSGSGT